MCVRGRRGLEERFGCQGKRQAGRPRETRPRRKPSLSSCLVSPNSHLPSLPFHSDMTTPAAFLSYVDSHEEDFIKRLSDAVAIPVRSPSHQPRMSCLSDHSDTLLLPPPVRLG